MTHLGVDYIVPQPNQDGKILKRLCAGAKGPTKENLRNDHELGSQLHLLKGVTSQIPQWGVTQSQSRERAE